MLAYNQHRKFFKISMNLPWYLLVTRAVLIMVNVMDQLIFFDSDNYTGICDSDNYHLNVVNSIMDHKSCRLVAISKAQKFSCLVAVVNLGMLPIDCEIYDIENPYFILGLFRTWEESLLQAYLNSSRRSNFSCSIIVYLKPFGS